MSISFEFLKLNQDQGEKIKHKNIFTFYPRASRQFINFNFLVKKSGKTSFNPGLKFEKRFFGLLYIRF